MVRADADDGCGQAAILGVSASHFVERV